MGMMAPPEMTGIARRAVRAAGQNLRPESIITDISVKKPYSRALVLVKPESLHLFETLET
jgi:hypothetical protein